MSISLSLRRLSALAVAGILTASAGLHAQFIIDDTYRASFPPLGKAYFSATDRPADKTDDRGMLSTVPTKLYNHGDPTNDEQYMLEMVNRARANPTAEGERLASVTDADLSAAYNYFNINREKLRNDFKAYPVRPPLAFNASLINAARNHSRDMDQNNFQGHTGSNGSSLSERMVAAGYGDGAFAGENAAAYSNSPFYGHVSLNVDWGEQNQIDLGHRRNIMNFGNFEYTEIGIGIIYNGKSLPHTGPYVITQDFGRHSVPFLVGVVYEDKNGNNFYDPGEGIPGVTIMPSSGDYYAITSASGGYAIPAPKSGSWGVTASGGPLSTAITLNTTFAGDNVKLDFTPAMTGGPKPVALTLPEANATITTDHVELSWESPQGITLYHLQVSHDVNFTSELLVDDSTLTTASYAMHDLHNRSYYYWRVRAKNASGWSVYSEKRLFEVAMPPAAVTLTSPADKSNVTPGTVEFQWTPGAEEVDRYWFEIATDPQMSNLLSFDSTVSSAWWSVSNLADGTTYYWRVKAGSSAGWGPFSDIWSVSASTSGVLGETANSAFRLSANTPNPFSASTLISFHLHEAQNVTLSVVNNLGQQVELLLSEKLTAGEHQVRWNPEGMQSGVYYYQLRAGDRTETRSMILAR